MIPEYRIIRPLLKLKNNSILKKDCKKILSLLDYRKKNKTSYFIFNSVNNGMLFNNTVSLMAHLNKIELPQFLPLISNFNFLVASLRPVFNFQLLYYRDYKNMSQILLSQALTDETINQWYHEAESIPTKRLDFLTNNKKLPDKIIIKIKILTHVTGKLLQALTTDDRIVKGDFAYDFGYYLMLFYLLQTETKQTLKFQNNTNWNLKSYFNYQDLYLDKLTIITKLNDSLMNFAEQNFNLYWRVVNYALNNSFES